MASGARPHLDVRRSIKGLGEAKRAEVTGVGAPASRQTTGSPRIIGLPARVCSTPDWPALGGPQASPTDWLFGLVTMVQLSK